MSLAAFRPATQDDATHLALFADMATRRLTSHLWGLAADPGQSAFAIGRTNIRDNETHFIHFRNWQVAMVDGHIVGAFNGYIVPAPTSPPRPGPEVLQALNALKDMAAGTWYISAAAIYPEHQGRGLGRTMLDHAEICARQTGAADLTLMVGSFNTRAHRLYLRCGFRETARRPFLPFSGSDGAGDWILMTKPLV